MAKNDIPLGQQSAWERWELASFDAPKPVPEPVQTVTEVVEETIHLPTAEELEEVQQRAHDEGYQAGFDEGREQALTEGREQSQAEVQRLAGLCEQLERDLGNLNQVVANDVLDLALEIARQVMRQTITQKPESILPVVREAINLLPHQHASIFLHPDDLALVRKQIGEQLTHLGHRLFEDAHLAPGDCRVEAGNSQVDATLATRWQRVIADLGLNRPLQEPTPTAEPPSTDEEAS